MLFREKQMNKLTKASFMQKIMYQRLKEKYNITDINFDEMGKIIKQYTEMMNEYNYNNELLKTLPISKVSFKNICDTMIVRMKNVGLIPSEATRDDIDSSYIEAICESLLYAHKTFLFCAVVNPNARIGTFKELRGIKTPFTKAGYDTLLLLALVYDNNTMGYSNPYLKGIGPKKYKDFEDFFALNFGIEVIEN